jgi:ketosteroid isomerase-like protein
MSNSLRRLVRVAVVLTAAGSSGGCVSAPADPLAAAREVEATERAFAATLAGRDAAAFARFLSPDAVFFSGHDVDRGPAAVVARWQPYFAGADAPFAWAPDHVEVLASGALALSTGPVTAHGAVVGRFNSIWRREAPGTWRIVFDKGEPACAGAP